MSFDFFKDIWRQDLQKLLPHRKKFRGFYIYAIDGDHLDLPASEDVLKRQYRGVSLGDKETHYPKMYTTQVMDVINGLVVDFDQSMKNDEVMLARQMAARLESKSIALYDRLHCSYTSVQVHIEKGSYFIIRVKANNPKIQEEIKSFCRSKKRSKWINLQAGKAHQKENPSLQGLLVRLVKIKNPRTKEDLVLMTNLSEKQFLNKELGELYQRRWEIEGSFRDLTSTLKMNHWHSKKLNGILQEIYALLWLVNQVRIQLAQIIDPKYWLQRDYGRGNFKFCISLVVDELDLLCSGKTSRLQNKLNQWIRRTIEKRRHLSRQYPRQIKRFGKKYKFASTVERRP